MLFKRWSVLVGFALAVSGCSSSDETIDLGVGRVGTHQEGLSLYPSEALVEGTLHSWFIKEPDPMNSEVAPDIVIVQWDATGLENSGTSPAVEAYYCDDHATTGAESVGAEVAGAATAVACSSGELPLTHIYAEDTSANTWYRTVIRHCPYDIVSGAGSTLATLLDLDAAVPNGCVETTTNYSVSDVTPTIAGVSGTGTVDEGAVYSLSISADTGAADGTSDNIATYDVDWGEGAGFVLNVGPTPTHIYDAQGSYTITVKVHDEDSEVSDTHAVLAGDVSPVISSIVDSIEFIEGSSGTLTITAASGADNGSSDAIVSFDVDWDNDGNFELDVGATPSHTYVNNSSPTNLVTVRVNDEDSFTTQTFDLTVKNANVENLEITQNGVSILTGSGNDATVNEGENITLAVSATDPGVNDVLVYAVDWGDGTSTELDTVTSYSHTYLNDGTYTITLVVEDGDGGHSTATATALVSDVSPSITSVVPGAFFEGTPGAFVVTANAGNIADPLNATAYAYDCENDGSFSPWQASATFECTFGDEGAYTVGVQVRDEDNTVADVGTVTVVNVAPANLEMTLAGSSIVSTPGAGIEGTELTITVSATDAGTSDVLTYTVDWGDGSSETRTGTDFSHTYGDQGTKFVSLQVDDGDGGVTSAQGSIAVGDVSPSIVVNVDGAPWEEGVASTIDVTGTAGALEDSLDPSPYSYRCISDGSALCGADVNGDYLNVPAPGAFIAANTFDCTFADNGTYGIEIWARDEDSYTCASLNPSVANVAPGIPQIVGNAPVAEGSSISLTVSATDVAADTMEYTIAWGDGSSDDYQASESFTHAYSEDGDFTITVTAKDKDDGTTSVDAIVTVTDIHPTISAVATVTLDEGQTTGNGIPLTGVAAGSADALHASPYAYVCKAAGTLLADVCADSDGDATNGAFDNVPAEGAFSSSNVALCTFDEDGAYYLEIWARDEDSYDCGSITVTVNDVDPVLFGGASHFAVSGYTEGAPASITIDAASGAEDGTSDNLDANAYAYDCDGGVNWSAFQASNEFTCTFADNGTYPVAVKAQDEDSSTSGMIDVVVDNVAPVITAVPGGYTCTAPVLVDDQGNDEDTLGTWVLGGGDTLWQSFTAGETGVLGSAGLKTNGPHNATYTVTVFEGEGTGGNVLYTEAGWEIHNNNVYAVHTFSSAIPVVAGSQYTFKVEMTAQTGSNHFTTDQNVSYGGGMGWLNQSWFDSWGETDLTFTTTVLVSDLSCDPADAASCGSNVGLCKASPRLLEGTDTFDFAGASFSDPGDDSYTAVWTLTDPVDGVLDFPISSIIVDGDATGAALNHLLGAADASYAPKDDQSGPNATTVVEACLTVSDDDGDSDTECFNITLENAAPVITEFVADTTTLSESDAIIFTTTVTDAGNGGDETLTYTWSWGDGTTSNTSEYNLPLGTHKTSHIFKEAGEYTVSLTVSDDDGGSCVTGADCSGTTVSTVGVTVVNVSPTIIDVLTTGNKVEGAPIEALVKLERHDVGVLSYKFDWGDGTIDDGAGNAVSHDVNDVFAGDDWTCRGGLNDGESCDHRVSTDCGGEGTCESAWGSRSVGVHTYAQDGEYTILVYVQDQSGTKQTNDVSQQGLNNGEYFVDLPVSITVGNVAPTGASISFASPGIEGGLIAATVAEALDAGSDDATLTYTVDWGDGSTPDTQTTHEGFTHVYSDNGNYVANLVVTDSDGASAQGSASVVISNEAPVSLIDNASGVEGAAISVAVSAAADAGDDAHVYRVDWGDGESSVQHTHSGFSHVYADDGSYTAMLTVTDEDGGVVSSVSTITVGNVTPVGVGLSLPASADEGVSIAATVASAMDVYADPLTYTINWGDGTSESRSTHAGFVHTYGDNGAYTVTLTVDDGDGGVVSYPTSIAVANVLPAGVSLANAAGIEGGVVNAIVGTATDVAGDALSYTINWGDGSAADTKSGPAGFTHVYADDGLYTATLTVTDKDGGEASASASMRISNVLPVVSAVTPAPIDEGTAVFVEVTALDAGDDALTFLVDWDGDGSFESVAPSHTAGDVYTLGSPEYGDNGLYIVPVRVMDGGVFTALDVAVVVNNLDPTLSSPSVATSGREGSEAVQVTVSATDVTADSASLEYRVDWGDGEVSTSSSDVLSHVYGNDGAYTATVTVEDKDGGSVQETVSVTVSNVAPVIDLVAVASPVLLDSVTSITVTATDPGSDELTYFWDFDYNPAEPNPTWEHTSTSNVASYTYETSGDYSVRVKVSDGAEEVYAEKTVVVLNQTSLLTVEADNESPAEGSSVTLTLSPYGSAGDVFTVQVDWEEGGVFEADETIKDVVASESGFGTLEIAHVYADNQVANVRVKAFNTHKDNELAMASLELDVLNEAPVVTSVAPDADASEGGLYEHGFVAEDPAGENDPLVYTLAVAPSGMTLDSVTGALAWTPDYTHVRESASQLHSVAVVVSDDDGGSTRVEWTVAVARLDADSDGLSDAWEVQHFGDAASVNGAAGGDSDGDGLLDSAEFGYGTNPLVSNAPGKPVSLHPGNIYVEALTQSLVVENAVDPDQDSLTYTFELYDNPALSGAAVFRAVEVPEGEGTTSVVIEEGVLSDYQRYWWVAYGNDGLVDGAHSDTVWFEVSTANRVPPAPVALMPVADEVVTTLQPYFEAQRVVDPDGDAVTYEFAVYTDASATAEVRTVAGRVAPTWFYPVEMTNSTTYWWRVRAHDGVAPGAWSRAQAFRLMLPVVNTPPTAPAIESPVVGGVLTAYSPTLTVGASTDAEGNQVTYDFEVALNAAFEGPSVGSTTMLRGTSWTPRELRENTLYYWRARAFDGELYSGWTVGYFTMNSENDAPGAPVALSPANGVVVPAKPEALTVINATDLDGDTLTYNFQLAADPEGITILKGKATVESGENTTTWNLGDEEVKLEDFTTYYWRAQAFDGTESGEFTPWQAFSLFLPKDYREVAVEEIVAHGCSSFPPGIWLLLPLLGFLGRRRRRTE